MSQQQGPDREQRGARPGAARAQRAETIPWCRVADTPARSHREHKHEEEGSENGGGRNEEGAAASGMARFHRKQT
ncbi:hypothetical protein F2P81_010135 [Scophthalmus maximus]|uniref:Uncharacterized protein n=1 Tax=Scophthalmus maximus TaxID=52904 RepID=A0A6A4T202_SCOMX|nr:hypothetical protein F2P81_010135 [Scophthalmus maximus]